jgi:hypothetical protein
MLARKPLPGGMLLVLTLTVLSGTTAVRGQGSGLPPAPVAFVPPPAPPQPELGRPIPIAPPPAPAPAPGPAPAPLAPAPTPLTWTPPPPPPHPTTDPGPNGWAPYEAPSVPPGFFFDLEINVLLPVLKNKITNDNGVLPSGNQLNVPRADLDVTVSPKFELGYRLPDSAGLFAGSYRFTTSEGTGVQTIGGADFNTRTRLNFQVWDLDYGTTMYEVAPEYKIGWRIGARLADIFFDSRIQNTPLMQQASNTYIGTGPHARLDVERRIGAIQGLSLFGRLDGSVLIGQINQRFREEAAQEDGSTLVSTGFARHSQSVPNLLLQAGLSYVPPIFTNVTFTTGYQFEQYWYLGQFNSGGMPGTSRGELWTHGWFLRGQVDF